MFVSPCVLLGILSHMDMKTSVMVEVNVNVIASYSRAELHIFCTVGLLCLFFYFNFLIIFLVHF